ncbi:MAG: glycosyltransferase family 9 protein [Calothrix sp. SM1_5_4]|nr:glycosyltransferase family 9 protein [Calothrix sp. SM1_5_4]
MFIGSAGERALSETVARIAAADRVDNRVGQTDFAEVFSLLASSRLLIGADSAPVHMAALTATPVLNLSSATVNFWETGPLSAGSRVLFEERLPDIDPTRVSRRRRRCWLGVLRPDRAPSGSRRDNPTSCTIFVRTISLGLFCRRFTRGHLIPSRLQGRTSWPFSASLNWRNSR